MAPIPPASVTRSVSARIRSLSRAVNVRRRGQRDAGAYGALVPGKRGPKTAEPNPLTVEMARLQRNNAHLTRRLVRAEAIIDIQKKVAALLGIPLAPNGEEP